MDGSAMHPDCQYSPWTSAAQEEQGSCCGRVRAVTFSTAYTSLSRSLASLGSKVLLLPHLHRCLKEEGFPLSQAHSVGLGRVQVHCRGGRYYTGHFQTPVKRGCEWGHEHKKKKQEGGHIFSCTLLQLYNMPFLGPARHFSVQSAFCNPWFLRCMLPPLLLLLGRNVNFHDCGDRHMQCPNINVCMVRPLCCCCWSNLWNLHDCSDRHIRCPIS